MLVFFPQLQYEDRIRELESQLAKCQHPEEGERPHTHSSALQRELDSVRERHKRKVGELEQELERLRKEVMVLKHRETGGLVPWVGWEGGLEGGKFVGNQDYVC